jgi:hypothetical protein
VSNGVRAMRSQTITTRTGEPLTLYQAEDGSWCCPVCGSPELSQAPYFDDGSASFEMCSCGFEFGYDDDAGACAQALPTVAANLERWRSNLLQRTRGFESAYGELRAQLASIGVLDV